MLGQGRHRFHKGYSQPSAVETDLFHIFFITLVYHPAFLSELAFNMKSLLMGRNAHNGGTTGLLESTLFSRNSGLCRTKSRIHTRKRFWMDSWSKHFSHGKLPQG